MNFIWQTQEWGEMLLASSQAVSLHNIEGIIFEKRSIGLGQYALFALGVSKNQTFSQIFDKKCKKLCQEQKACFAQLETLNYDTQEKRVELTEKMAWKQGAYKKFIMPCTAVIDLTLSEEEILSAMKPKGRYNIKLAQKRGVDVGILEANQENVQGFYTLMEETTTRDGFSGNTLKYYMDFLSNIPGSVLFGAFREGKLTAAGIFVFKGEVAYYYYGASSGDREETKHMAPYLLQWTAMMEGKKRGAKIYDFLGVAPEGAQNHSLAGTTDFKKKFTSDIRQVSESYMLISSPLCFWFLSFIRKIKKRIP